MPEIHNTEDRMSIEDITKGLASAKHTFEAKQRKTLQEFNRTERALFQELQKILGYKIGDRVSYDGHRYRVSGFDSIAGELRVKLARTLGSGLLRKNIEIKVKHEEVKTYESK